MILIFVFFFYYFLLVSNVVYGKRHKNFYWDNLLIVLHGHILNVYYFVYTNIKIPCKTLAQRLEDAFLWRNTMYELVCVNDLGFFPKQATVGLLVLGSGTRGPIQVLIFWAVYLSRTRTCR